MKQTSCVNCKKGKRKCSRDQPKCERCQKLKKNCVYIEVVNKKICLEQKMAKIEYCYKIIKKTALQNQLEVYKNLISHYFTNFGVFIPFIQLQKGLKAIEYEPHNSLLANALCILPYQFYLKENNILNNKGSDNKNPFYTRATTLLTSLTDNSDLDTIQSLLLISYYELGESQLPISLKHLSQAVSKAHTLDLDKSTFKLLTQDPDLQVEYIATWSTCQFFDLFTSTFAAHPPITYKKADYEQLENDVEKGVFSIQEFEINGIIEKPPFEPIEFSEYLDSIAICLSLNLKSKTSRLFLNTVAYGKAAQYILHCFVYRKQLADGLISADKFIDKVTKALNLVRSILPYDVNVNYLSNIYDLNDPFDFHFACLFFTIVLFEVYILRMFGKGLEKGYWKVVKNPEHFNHRLYERLRAGYNVLNHNVPKFWIPLEKTNFAIAGFSLMAIYYFYDNPNSVAQKEMELTYTTFYRNLEFWPLLYNLMYTRCKGSLQLARQIFPDIDSIVSCKLYLA